METARIQVLFAQHIVHHDAGARYDIAAAFTI
ncbi:hypothetical protein CODIS_40910 [Candidatus Thiodiazotropha endolucinida]|uniref:Uncharacterized protein n=1 Tax=Candidatus Thiodiazotropha endolucinida TaxID=1655433 RepID=A0A7Z0VHJ2_9GAMM|nr:hypothetical protein CODIS_40910 [Candidatus Thiodiazotropha endolucinida]